MARLTTGPTPPQRPVRLSDDLWAWLGEEADRRQDAYGGKHSRNSVIVDILEKVKKEQEAAEKNNPNQ